MSNWLQINRNCQNDPQKRAICYQIGLENPIIEAVNYLKILISSSVKKLYNLPWKWRAYPQHPYQINSKKLQKNDEKLLYLEKIWYTKRAKIRGCSRPNWVYSGKNKRFKQRNSEFEGAEKLINGQIQLTEEQLKLLDCQSVQRRQKGKSAKEKFKQ